MVNEIPSPRKSGHITVKFTPRVFPTAARESQEGEETEVNNNDNDNNKRFVLDILFLCIFGLHVDKYLSFKHLNSTAVLLSSVTFLSN